MCFSRNQEEAHLTSLCMFIEGKAMIMFWCITSIFCCNLWVLNLFSASATAKNCNKNVKSFTYWSSFLKSIKNTIILYYTTKYKHLCKIIRCFRTTIVNAQYHASWANNSIFKQLILDTSHILILNLVITKINVWLI